MIVTSEYKLIPGQIYDHMSNGGYFAVWDANYTEYRFLILREATQEEYIEYLKTEYPNKSLIGLHLCSHYYEISMD